MSYGGNADPTGIQVTFLDQTGAKSVKAVIAFSVPVSRILPNIITKMSLPTTSPDGQPMSYSLDHKEGGRRLLESQTLVEAGVQNGDHLIVYPEVVAGRALTRPATRIVPSGSSRSERRERVVSRCMHDSPRLRRLRIGPRRARSARATKVRCSEFRDRASPVQHYQIEFQGKSLARRPGEGRRPRTARGRDQARRLVPADDARDPLADPDLPPEYLRDRHGLPRRYGTHWVPSLNLDELCVMLWDMARYHNYDIRSPYNREAALWVANQTTYRFPLDPRPLRDLRVALGRVEKMPPHRPRPRLRRPSSPRRPREACRGTRAAISSSSASSPRACDRNPPCVYVTSVRRSRMA